MNSLVAELFSVGKWNGLEFTMAELKQIESNFKKLSDAYKVPLKLGHNDDQKITDGLPALGWVDSVWLEGGKLLGKFVDMPDVVYKSIKKKLYNAVSIELLFDVEHGKERFDNVLSGVALLGADLPAVKNLKSLSAYMSMDTAAFSSRQCFTQTFKEHEKMPKTVEELQEELAAANAKLAEASAKNITFSAENEALKIKEKQREEDATKKAVSDKRNTINAMFEDAVKAKKMLPAQRESFSKLLRLDDDESIKTIDLETVKTTIGSVSSKNSGSNFSDDKAHAKGSIESGQAAEKELLTLARKYQFDNNGMKFEDAVTAVQLANPDLAKEYFYANGMVG